MLTARLLSREVLNKKWLRYFFFYNYYLSTTCTIPKQLSLKLIMLCVNMTDFNYFFSVLFLAYNNLLVKFTFKKITTYFFNYFYNINSFVHEDKHFVIEQLLSKHSLFFDMQDSNTKALNFKDLNCYVTALVKSKRYLSRIVKKYEILKINCCATTSINAVILKNKIASFKEIIIGKPTIAILNLKFLKLKTIFLKNYCELFLDIYNYSLSCPFFSFYLIIGSIYLFLIKNFKEIKFFNFFRVIALNFKNFYIILRNFFKSAYAFYKHSKILNFKFFSFFSNFKTQSLVISEQFQLPDLFFYKFYKYIFNKKKNSLCNDMLIFNVKKLKKAKLNPKTELHFYCLQKCSSFQIIDNDLLIDTAEQQKINNTNFKTLNFKTLNFKFSSTTKNKNNISFSALNFKFSSTTKNKNKARMLQRRRQKKNEAFFKNFKKITNLYEFILVCLPDAQIKNAAHFKKINGQLNLLYFKREALQEQYVYLHTLNQELTFDVFSSDDRTMDSDYYEMEQLRQYLNMLDLEILALVTSLTVSFVLDLWMRLEKMIINLFKSAAFNKLFFKNFSNTPPMFIIFNAVCVSFLTTQFLYKLYNDTLLNLIEQISIAANKINRSALKNFLAAAANTVLPQYLINFFIILKLWNFKNKYLSATKELIQLKFFLQLKQLIKTVCKKYKSVKKYVTLYKKNISLVQELLKDIRYTPQINCNLFFLFLYIIPNNFIYLYIFLIRSKLQKNMFFSITQREPILSNFFTNLSYFYKNIIITSDGSTKKNKIVYNKKFIKKISFLTNFLTNFIEHMTTTAVNLNIFFYKIKMFSNSSFLLYLKNILNI